MMSLPQRLLVAFLLLAVPVSGEEVFRLFFRYGFEDGQIGDPNSKPTAEDVKALMCKTNEFFTDSIRNYTDNEKVEFFATDISFDFQDWIYNGTEPEAPRNVPVIVNFTAKLVTSDGSPVPTNQELWEGTKYFEYFSYIMNYIWKIEGNNFFKDTRGLWYEPFIQPPEEGQIPSNDQCPAPADGRGQEFVLTSMEPSTIPSVMPSIMPSSKVPTGRFTPLFPVPIPPNTPDPTSAVPSVAPSSKAPTDRLGGLELQTMAPTRAEDEMVYFTIQTDFFAGKEKEPTDEEVQAMMCQTDEFFKKTLQEKISPAVEVFSTNINWEWDDRAGLPSVVEFFANATFADGSHVPAEQVFNAMEQVDVKQFVQDYVWISEPYKENQFYQTEDIFFAGSYTGSSNPPDPHPGKIARVQCGNP